GQHRGEPCTSGRPRAGEDERDTRLHRDRERGTPVHRILGGGTDVLTPRLHLRGRLREHGTPVDDERTLRPLRGGDTTDGERDTPVRSDRGEVTHDAAQMSRPTTPTSTTTTAGTPMRSSFPRVAYPCMSSVSRGTPMLSSLTTRSQKRTIHGLRGSGPSARSALDPHGPCR